MLIKQSMLANLVPDDQRSTFMAKHTVAMIVGVSTAGLFIIISKWLHAYILTGMMVAMGVVSIGLFIRVSKSSTVKSSHTDVQKEAGDMDWEHL